MREGDPEFEALRDAIDAYGLTRAADVVAEARIAAEAKVRAMLTDAIAESLLEHAEPGLEQPGEGGVPNRRGAATTAPSGPTAEAGERAASPEGRSAPRTEADQQPSGPPNAPAPDEEAGYYVYGVISAAEVDLEVTFPGLDPAEPAGVIRHAGLAAIASRVSLNEFGEEQLHEHLNDVAWLEETARAHEQVLEQALSQTTVVPMRLCTIYRSESHVKEMLEAERVVFNDALARLEGRTEWGVKLIAEPGALSRAAAPTGSADEDGSLSPGAAYMRGKSREARTRDELDRIAETWAEAVHERLAELAAEALINPVQNPEVSGHVGDMLLNGVYLVAEGTVDEFRDEVARMGAEYEAAGASLELTGPWPPYNFVKGSIEAAR